MEKQIAGLASSKCVLVIVTKRYCEKVYQHRLEDYCQLEFNYADKMKGINNMLAVIFDKSMRDTADWEGEVGMILGGKPYVDITGDIYDTEYMKNVINELEHQIRQIIAKKKPIIREPTISNIDVIEDFKNEGRLYNELKENKESKGTEESFDMNTTTFHNPSNLQITDIHYVDHSEEKISHSRNHSSLNEMTSSQVSKLLDSILSKEDVKILLESNHIPDNRRKYEQIIKKKHINGKALNKCQLLSEFSLLFEIEDKHEATILFHQFQLIKQIENKNNQNKLSSKSSLNNQVHPNHQIQDRNDNYNNNNNKMKKSTTGNVSFDSNHDHNNYEINIHEYPSTGGETFPSPNNEIKIHPSDSYHNDDSKNEESKSSQNIISNRSHSVNYSSLNLQNNSQSQINSILIAGIEGDSNRANGIYIPMNELYGGCIRYKKKGSTNIFLEYDDEKYQWQIRVPSASKTLKGENESLLPSICAFMYIGKSLEFIPTPDQKIPQTSLPSSYVSSNLINSKVSEGYWFAYECGNYEIFSNILCIQLPQSVSILGTTGYLQDIINGIYDPIPELYGGIFRYEKRGSDNICIEYFLEQHQWQIKRNIDKTTSYAFAYCFCPNPLPLTDIVSTWYVFAGVGNTQIQSNHRRNDSNEDNNNSNTNINPRNNNNFESLFTFEKQQKILAINGCQSLFVGKCSTIIGQSVSGRYKPTNEIYNGWIRYHHEDITDLWLEYCEEKGSWQIKSAIEKESSNCIAFLKCTPVSLPINSKIESKWHIYDDGRFSIDQTMECLISFN